jgi:hypothetical protein
MSATVQNARAIEAALQPLMGTAASGSLTVRSTGLNGTVPYGSALIPILRGGLEEEATAFVPKNPATASGAWPIVQAGTTVPVVAVQGGAVGNTPPGTQYRWNEPLEGIESVSVSAAGLAGGAASTAYAALKQLRHYKALTQNLLEDFLRASLGQFPAGLLAWDSTQPLDGPMAARPAPRAARAGRGKVLFRHTWILFLVSSRLDSEAERRREGDTLRDDVIETLLDTTSARGLRVSTDPGAEILDARIHAVTPTSYVDLVRFATTVTVQHRPQGATYNNWLRTRLRQQTAAQGIYPPIHLPDVTIPMPPGGS